MDDLGIVKRSGETSMDYWENRNVFVTGGTGLLGSWLINELVKQKVNITCLLRDSVPNSNFYLLNLDKKVNIVRGTLEDYFLINRTLNEYEIETVFHLGAQTIVGLANRSPLGTFEANIKGTWNVLESCRNSKWVEKVVVASTDKAYGSQKILPYNEDTPLQGEHPYDVSKSCADLISLAYYTTYGLPVGVTRCGNFYGGGDLNFNRIVPGTVRSLQSGEAPIIRSDGSYVRDYIYVLDGVDAYLTFAKALEHTSIQGNAFNFSTENPVTVLALVKKIIAISGKNLKPQVLGKANGEIKKQYLSCQKARELLGWKHRYDLDSGLKETYLWYEEFFRK